MGGGVVELENFVKKSNDALLQAEKYAAGGLQKSSQVWMEISDCWRRLALEFPHGKR